MHISLIGMSGTGKSHWARQLEQSGFKRFYCDDLIRTLVTPLLKQSDGTQMRMGEWMGLPYEARYKNCEEIYLQYEDQILIETLEYIVDAPKEENVVIDTTGSVIYVNESSIKALKENTVVVHLETSPDIRKEMAEQYIKKPLTVLWRDKFDRRPEESIEQALGRCYQDLIASREVAYVKLAHVSIPYERHRDKDFGVDSLLAVVRNIT